MTKVLIAIQARSGSKRLPGKSLKMLDDKIMVNHVFSTAQGCANFIMRSEQHNGLQVKVALLIPEGDDLKKYFHPSEVIEGPEDDVLRRYQIAFDSYKPDYIVRLTGDCPLIISPIISKHIQTAVKLGLDYCSNAFEELRTFVDGFDCEVISAKAFEWLCENVKDAYDKEHVTTMLRREKPRWANFAVILSHVDLADIKLSVDTLHDFEEVQRRKQSLDEKMRLAKERGYIVFRF